MNLAPFKHVLALPGVRAVMVLMLFARIAPTAAGVTLTLHVVMTLNMGYAAAGTVGFAALVGIGIGSPLMGKLIDSRGLRTTLVVSVIAESGFWFLAPLMGYELLLLLAFANGLLAVPMMSIGRQALTALVPEAQRRAAFSLDSISVELSFMVGPATGSLLATKVSSVTAMMAIGGTIFVAGALLFLINPPLVHEDEVAEGPAPAWHEWLRGPMIAALVAAFGATMVLSGMELAAIANLERSGKGDWLAVIFVVMCAASAFGGLVYGGRKKVPGPAVLLGAMAIFALPVALVGEGNVWLLALALIPMNFVCAPTIAATSERITKIAPPAARGLAIGLQGSAFTFGAAVGNPLAGFGIDLGGAGIGFLTGGVTGVLIAGVAWSLSRQKVRQAVSVTS